MGRGGEAPRAHTRQRRRRARRCGSKAGWPSLQACADCGVRGTAERHIPLADGTKTLPAGRPLADCWMELALAGDRIPHDLSGFAWPQRTGGATSTARPRDLVQCPAPSRHRASTPGVAALRCPTLRVGGVSSATRCFPRARVTAPLRTGERCARSAAWRSSLGLGLDRRRSRNRTIGPSGQLAFVRTMERQRVSAAVAPTGAREEA
jgi:hypothetical protein